MTNFCGTLPFSFTYRSSRVDFVPIFTKQPALSNEQESTLLRGLMDVEQCNPHPVQIVRDEVFMKMWPSMSVKRSDDLVTHRVKVRDTTADDVQFQGSWLLWRHDFSLAPMICCLISPPPSSDPEGYSRRYITGCVCFLPINTPPESLAPNAFRQSLSDQQLLKLPKSWRNPLKFCWPSPWW